jgi:2-polyprenyl-3-methyl-5-hydroxy-6-metoxy-1,4-benzoquinol methylase
MDAQATWDARFRERTRDDAQPALVLSDNTHLLPSSGRALDLACGLGGNALLLARLGLEVTAYDISAVAIEKLDAYARQHSLPVCARRRDVEKEPPDSESFDVITVSYFLSRPLMPGLVAALKPNGLLFYQTFIRECVAATGPSNPDFRLVTNELLELCADLSILFYREEGRVGDIGRGFRNEAMLIGQKP